MDELDLLDWKRRVFALYAGVRAGPVRWRTRWQPGAPVGMSCSPATRRAPCRPRRRADFAGLPYFPFDSAARVTATVAPAERHRFEVVASAGEPMAFVRFAVARFSLAGTAL